MKLDFSKFKKLSYDEQKTTLQHPDGHTIQIAHKALSPKMKAQLDKLPFHSGKEIEAAQGGDINQLLEKKRDFDKANRKKMDMGEEQEPYPREIQNLIDSGVNANTGKAAGGTVRREVSSDPKDEVKKYGGGLLKMAEGGETPESAPSESTPTETPQEDASPALPTPAPTDAKPVTININNPAPPMPAAMLNPQVQPTNPQALPTPVPTQAPMQTPAQAPAQAPTLEQKAEEATPPQAHMEGMDNPPDVLSGYKKQVSGLENQAAGESRLGKEQESALKAQAQAGAQLMQQYQDHWNNLDQERQALQQDINEKQIDPNHYLGSMDTMSRIATAIGLVAGGLGAGLSHTGVNQAQQFLQKQIDQDIEAQRSELGKKENLLSANMRQFGNLRDATEMTKVMLNDMTINQLKQAEARASAPLAKARLQQQIGALEQQNAPMFQSLVLRQSLLSKGSQEAGQSGPSSLLKEDPSKLVPFVVPKEKQTEAFKELKEAQEMSKAKENILHAFSELEKINTVDNRVKSPIQTHRQVAAIRDPLVAKLSKDTAGRFTEQDAKLLETLFPEAGDSEHTLATKRGKIQNMLEEKMNFPTLSAYQLDPSKFESTAGNLEAKLSPQQQSFAKWAKDTLQQDPNNMKAKLVLKKLGLQ